MTKQIQVPVGAVYVQAQHQDVQYGLASDGRIFALSNGKAFEIPEHLEESIRRKNFPQSSKPVQRKRTLSDMSDEAQDRYHAAADIVAGVKLNVAIADRRRAVKYLGVVHSWLSGQDKNSDGP